MAEESQVSEDVPKRGRVAMHVPMIVKTIEVVLSIFAIGLLVDPLNSLQKVFNKPRMKLDDAATIYVTVAGYILINTLFVISHMLGDRIPKRTLILFASVGALMHIVAGSLIVHNWRKIHGPSYHVQNNEIYPSKQYMDMMISAAVFTFVNVVAFTTEVFLIIRYSTRSVH